MDKGKRPIDQNKEIVDRPLSPKLGAGRGINRVGLEASGHSSALQVISELSKRMFSKEGRNITQADLQNIVESSQEQRDTSMEAFRRGFSLSVKEQKKGIFKVASRAKAGGGLFINQIDVANGITHGISNYKYNTKGWHLSEVLKHQIQLVKEAAGIEKFDLKEMVIGDVDNKETKSIVNRLYPEEKNKEFKSGTKEFMALKKTPLAKAIFYLLEQNPETFPGKEVKSITVCRKDGDIIMKYEIGDRQESK